MLEISTRTRMKRVSILGFASLVILTAVTLAGSVDAKSPSSSYIVTTGNKIKNLARDSKDWWHIKYVTEPTPNCDGGRLELDTGFKTSSEARDIATYLGARSWDVSYSYGVKGCVSGERFQKNKTLSCTTGTRNSSSKSNTVVCRF